MFEYNARTETIRGARFIEKDIILFDYSYTGDILFQADMELKASGVGFIIAEDDGKDIARSSNIYMIHLNEDDSYSVIYKTGSEQSTLVKEFVISPVNVYQDKDIIFFFRKHNETLLVNKAIRQQDGRYQEIELAKYKMPHDMENYKIGIYSNGGNTIKFASISTEAPTNWISNVFNANGGRIKWIKNGFEIDESEFNIEVEAENIELKAGTYYFAYETDNPDIESFIYLSYRRDTGVKRTRKEIIPTRMDEIKNILQEDGSFTLSEDHAINIKFRGKWGTVKNICVKKDKYSGFVETDYNTTYKEPGQLLFNLKKIKKIQLTAIVSSIPQQDLSEEASYHFFQRGSDIVQLQDKIGKKMQCTFNSSSGQLYVDGELVATMKSGDILSAFYNVTADITELIVTMANGKQVNVLLQKTIKATVGGEITSPIIVTFANDEPLNLSSSFRKVAETGMFCELYYAQNPIRLSYFPDITNVNISIYGIKSGVSVYDESHNITRNKVRIEYTPTKEDLLNKKISLPYSIRSAYKWIVVEYNAIQSTRYIFTNWEREIYDLQEDPKVYLESLPMKKTGCMIVRGVTGDSYLNKELLYYIPKDSMENAIDLSCYSYNPIEPNRYKTNKKGKIIFEDGILEPYRYLIIDYLKTDSYAVNQKDGYYEIDIASMANDYKILYDSKDGITTREFSALSVEQMKDGTQMEENDFIVLEASV